MIRIDAQMTLLVFMPIVIVITAAQLATVRLQKYRAASRESTSKVTGEISEMFGNVQAIQVAGAEKRVMERFRSFGDDRRKAMLKDRLMSELLDSVFSNSVNLGTGLLLLLAGTKMRAGTFTVGDLALFVYYLTFVTQFITNVGKFITYFKQMSVSLERLTFLLQGASARVLTMVKPLYLKKERDGEVDSGALKEGQDQPYGIVVAPPLQRLEVNGLSYTYPDTGRGIADINFAMRRRRRSGSPSSRERSALAKPR